MLTPPSAFWSPFWRILLIEMEYMVSLSCSLWKSYPTMYKVFFFNWYPPKKLKYGKPRLGESTAT